MQSSSHFYKDKDLFGLDIGSSSIKVMQLDLSNKRPHMIGYGSVSYDDSAVKDGVITDFKTVAKTIKQLIEHHVIGEINTRRVALSVPASRAFTRTVTLPASLHDNEIMEAVHLEAEQYIPVPIEELYVDYSVTRRTEDGVEILAVAAPKKIVDSYMTLVDILGFEPVAIDTTILAAARLYRQQIDETSDVPSVLIDFGSTSADITVYDKAVVVTGTIPGGGDGYTDLIAKKLGISCEEAQIVKTKYGISKSKRQAEIMEALEPRLDTLAKEIRRVIRYHEERSEGQQKIEQIVTMGGGANMPGLSEFLIDKMRIPVRMCSPWQNLGLGKLHPPNELEKSTYVTVTGLSLVNPKELFS